MDHETFLKQRIEHLAQRANRCCCKYCGGELELKMIVFASLKDAGVEIFCPHCNRIEYGVEPEIYRNARYFVENFKFNIYPEMEDTDNARKLNTAKICEILAWNDTQLGYLNDFGFVYEPLKYDKQVDAMDGSVIYAERELLDE